MQKSSVTHDDRIWCVIPTFNNRETLRRIVTECRRRLKNVVVIDDGSTDANVAALLEGVDATLLRHDRNRGKGRAILTALDFVRARAGEFLITIDADGQHDPRDIEKLAAAIREDNASLVVGCRDFSTAPVPRASRFGRSFSNFWLRLETGEVLEDSQCGFRAYPVKHLSRLPIASRHYDFEIEVLTRACWAGLRLRSVDVAVWYPDDPATRISTFRPLLDNLRISLTHARLIGRRLVPWPHRKLVRRRHRRPFFLEPRAFLLSALKEHSTPAGLAASAAVGIFFGTLPLIATHLLVIIYVTTRLNLNRVVALGIQNLCIPPFVPLACIELGHYLRYGKWLTEASVETLFYEVTDRLFEWLIGSLLLAPLLAFVAGLLVYCLAHLAGARRVNS